MFRKILSDISVDILISLGASVAAHADDMLYSKYCKLGYFVKKREEGNERSSSHLRVHITV